MTTTTDKGLTDEELLAIVEAATPGEWQVVTDLPAYAVKSASRASIVQTPNQNAWNRYGPANEWDGVNGRGNADYIATFDPPMVRALIERARAAEARALAMEEALKRIAAQYCPDQGADVDLHECHKIAEAALSTEAQS